MIFTKHRQSWICPLNKFKRNYSNTPTHTKATIWRWGSTARPSVWSNYVGEISKFPKKFDEFVDVNVQSISAGRGHSAFVVDGQLFTFGNNKDNQLGRTTKDTEGKFFDHTPQIVKFDGDQKISSVSCGSFHTAAVTEEGLLYTWGWGGSAFSGASGLGLGNKNSYSRPQLVEKLADLNEPISKVACGHQHTLVLTKSGKVFSTGKGEFGRLGKGKNGDQLSFEEIDYFSTIVNDTKIISISCGASHSAALGENGQVWVWGRNDYGQLGLEDSMGDLYSNEIYPKIVSVLDKENHRIVDISAGSYHMLARSKNGLLFFWGGRAWLTPKNIFLGNTNSKDDRPMKLAKIEAGGDVYYYNIILDEDGNMYTWGKNASNCLINDKQTSSNEPCKIDPTMFDNQKVVDVACGHYRAMALTISPEIQNEQKTDEETSTHT